MWQHRWYALYQKKYNNVSQIICTLYKYLLEMCLFYFWTWIYLNLHIFSIKKTFECNPHLYTNKLTLCWARESLICQRCKNNSTISLLCFIIPTVIVLQFILRCKNFHLFMDIIIIWSVYVCMLYKMIKIKSVVRCRSLIIKTFNINFWINQNVYDGLKYVSICV